MNASEIIRRLEALSGRESVPQDYVSFRISILRVQTAALEQIESDSEPPSSHSDRTSLDQDTTSFAAQIVQRLFRDLAEVLASSDRVPDVLAKLRSACAADPDHLVALAKDAAFDPEGSCTALTAERWGVSIEVLVLVARLLAAPFVTGAAGRLAPLELSAAHAGGSCPRCSASPGLASLSPGEGLRILHCGLCGTSWPFARLVCPFCGNEEPAKLSRLAVADDDRRWLEACDACGHYLKTVDRRQLPEEATFFPLVEEVAGLYLDLIAEREGYAAKPPYAALC